MVTVPRLSMDDSQSIISMNTGFTKNYYDNSDGEDEEDVQTTKGDGKVSDKPISES